MLQAPSLRLKQSLRGSSKKEKGKSGAIDAISWVIFAASAEQFFKSQLLMTMCFQIRREKKISTSTKRRIKLLWSLNFGNQTRMTLTS